MIDARTLAYQILLDLGRKSVHPDRMIRAVLARHSRLEDRERALLTELVYGVLRWQGRLDWHIDQLSNVKPSKILPEMRSLLRLALYQMLFLDKIPAHAAVNEAVNLAKLSFPKHLTGFVNAVLREAVRREGRWDVPGLEDKPADHIAIMTAHPPWFVQRCLKEIGLKETLEFCRANNEVAPMVLRVNALDATVPQVIQALGEQGVDAEISPVLPTALRLKGLRQDVADLSVFKQGWVQVQDEASQLVSMLVAPRGGQRVLDLCAGFGGKTTHLAQLMGNQGEILSVDSAAWKLEHLRENAQRQGVSMVKVLAADVLELTPDSLGTFDGVLLDAPCTGFGALRRKPDIKWSRHLKDPYRFSQLQQNLLQRAAELVKPGGCLVYATCTIFREEDEGVAEAFSGMRAEFEVQHAGDFLPESCVDLTSGPFLRTWPHRHGVDGFFAARWIRRA